MTMLNDGWSGSELENADEAIEPSVSSTVIMAIMARRGEIGAAFIKSENYRVIHLMETQPDLPNLPTVENLLSTEEPDYVIVPGRSGKVQLLDTVKDHISKLNDMGVLSGKIPKIIIGLTLEFKQSNFTNIIPIEDESLIEKNSLTICAAAAVITFLRRQNFTGILPNDMAWFNLSSYMTITQDALLALQIISNESHPNVHFSKRTGLMVVLVLMNKCKSPAGRILFKQWLLRPLKDKIKIEKRLEFVEWIIKVVANHGLLPEIQRLLSTIPRVQASLASLLGQPSYGSFKVIHRFLKGLSELGQTLSSIPETRAELSIFNVDLVSTLCATISGIIDFVQSEAQERLVVKSKVNPDLDELRKKYHELPEFLSDIVKKVASRITNPLISTVNVVYFPQLGFLVTIPIEENVDIGNVKEPEPEFELQFTTEKVAYYKECTTRRLDEEIGDIYADMVDVEIEIIRVLIEQICPFYQELSNYEKRCAELDCILALAQFAIENNLTRPELTEADDDLYILNSRHILQERITDTIVSNDCILDQGRRILLLTGPNSSGKSVYMKQVALIVYMAHLGSFVPAEAARIGIVDKIFTRIQTRESISLNSSAFDTDLVQIQKALEGSGKRSMLLVDEFGKGTSPMEGIAVFAAIIKYLAQKGKEECPRTIAITHFHEIHQLGLLNPELPIKWCTMDILEGEGVTFLYKVVSGKASSSLGLHCARQAGIPERIIRRAEDLEKLYSAKVTPMCLRYASVDPKLEELSLELVKSVTEGNQNLHQLQLMAQALLSYQKSGQ